MKVQKKKRLQIGHCRVRRKKYVDELRRLAANEGCQEAVDFLGFMEDVRPVMDRAYALIVASRCEAFGRVTAEAAFRGCLVIGKDTGGTKEILDLTGGGILYSGNDQSLAEKMTQAIDLSEEQYINILEKAQKTAVQLFSNEQSGDSVYSFYQEVLSG